MRSTASRPFAALCPLLLLFALPLAAATFTSNAPTSTNNDDTCDIGLFPAATLLVPYFEVNLDGPPGSQTTILTVTNTSHLPQAVAMTLWTDYGYPVITFRIYLTGYDVQSINLFDIIRRGRIAADTGTGSDVSPVGDLSGTPPNQDFDNPQLDEATCVNLPVQLPSVFLTRMREAFTRGTIPAIGSNPGCTNVGGTHANAVGYVTLDVVGICGTTLPTDNGYFNAELRYDNVLMGDYLQVDGTQDFAQGSPMVHIRAIPEGGTPSTRRNNNFRRTFYSHLQPAASRTLDGRQPLPATFAARWIAGGGGDFHTSYKIWRGVETPANAACDQYTLNRDLTVAEIVRFDEEENPETSFTQSIADPPMQFVPKLPATALVPITSQTLPVNTNGAVAGWMYFNLHNGRGNEIATQNWVVSSMRAEGRFSVDVDAVALGNGCTPVTPVSNANVRNARPIGPSPNTTP